MDLIDPAVADLLLLIAGIFLLAFFLKGLFLINDNQVGILTRKMLGQPMPPGQVIARRGQVGVQATTLVPGLYWRLPIVWTIRKVAVVEISEDTIGTVESIDGQPLPKGRILGDEVESNQFQDAERFLESGGCKGPQIGILRPGKYRINTLAFMIKLWTATVVPAEKVGTVTAQDGRPLPPRFIIAPTPELAPTAEHPKSRVHNHFQDGQAFLDSGGFRGPQQDTLQPGKYYVNPLLFNVTVGDVFEVPPGFVAVLRSNIGEELERPETHPTPASPVPNLNQPITSAAEVMLTVDRNRRGIWALPIAPGKYNLNRIAFTAYLVPTSAIMIDWASSPSPGAPSLSRPPTAPRKDESDYPYLTEQSAEGVSFFRFSQLRVTSKDGFQLEVDVRMVIRILPENAAFIIARFGSIFNLIQQIVHPLIDASFRNNAGEKKALEFVQGRTQLQLDALERARKEFATHHVEALNLLISYIEVDPALLQTQTNKEIALQQQTQYEQQALAEEKRIAVQEKTARANLQPKVVEAELQVDINKNNAEAMIEQARGISESTRRKAEGEASAVKVVGEAQAAAYSAQANVIGAERVALIRVMERVAEGQVKITPDTYVVSGEEGTGAVFSAYLAMLLKGATPNPKKDEATKR